MAERTAAFNRFKRIPGFISRGRERIVGAFRSATNFFNGDLTTPTPTQTSTEPTQSKTNHELLPFPEVQLDRQKTQRLKMLDMLFNAVPENSKTLPGEVIESGQLELLAEAFAHHLEERKPLGTPRQPEPESLKRMSPDDLGTLTHLFLGNTAVWTANLAGIDLSDKPIKQSALSDLDAQLAWKHRTIICPDGLASFDNSLEKAKQFELEMANINPKN